ncbi:MAG: hypothetical protein JNL98_19825 [Bryobacterales bacterium]|nr:hypothetical protein [Bryobacterales bacterium]
MPFQSVIPRPFTASGIQTFAPAVSGVYGISNSQEWIYIGEADDIQRALMDHFTDHNGPFQKRSPMGFVYETCARASRAARQDRLVLEYEPACNRFPNDYRRHESGGKN